MEEHQQSNSNENRVDKNTQETTVKLTIDDVYQTINFKIMKDEEVENE